MENGTIDTVEDAKPESGQNDNQNVSSKEECNPEDECIVKMRGLPWSATAEDILKFLGDCNIKDGKDGIHLTMSQLGRPSGEAYIEFVSPEDASKALKKDREHIGHRYIEVFPTTRSEMNWVVSRCGLNLDNLMDEGCIRMRGLPYGCTKDEVAQFFTGLTIVPNGINFATDSYGRTTGEAYVQFVNKENVEKALKKHMEKIGPRYIEIFRSSLAEVHSQTGHKIRSSFSSYDRSAPYDRSNRFGGPNRVGGPPMTRGNRFRNGADWDDYGDNYWDNSGPGPTGRMKPHMRGGSGNYSGDDDYVDGPRHVIFMRGLPYRALEHDILVFFKPLEPVNVRIMYDETDRPSGEAVVEFSSHEEAVEAMSKDKEHIQNRYIELFLHSVPEYNDRKGGHGPGIGGTRSAGRMMHSRGPAFNSGGGPHRGRGGFRGGNRGQGP